LETLIRMPKGELYDDPIHNDPYLIWIQKQADAISKFANVIGEIQDEGKRRAIIPSRVHECAAKFVEFYTKNIAFKAIYDELAAIWSEKADKLYDLIYLEIKTEVTNYNTARGAKYKKKDATQKEVEKEMRTHGRYPEYSALQTKVEEYEKKAKTQDEYLKGLGRLDNVLRMLQRATEVELKYLHLET